MTRPWMISASTAAFALGMTLVHCSSSSSTGTTNVDAGSGHDAKSTGSSPGTGSGTSTTSGSGSAVSSGSGSSTGTGSGTTGSSSGSGTGTPGSGTGTGSDTYDAGPCVGPSGGAACDPGNVECDNKQCPVPQMTCCTTGSTPLCQANSATCTNPQHCDEKSDCPDGQICCLSATDLGNDVSITCQTGPTCPTVSGAVATAQLCKTNAECAGGTCSLWSCQGQTTEACQAPNAICSQM